MFDEQTPAARAAGLTLVHLWRSVEVPNEVFFLFDVEDIQRARAFVGSPGSAQAGARAGVVDGALWYVEEAG